jgi:hypothetical protein
VVPAHKGRYGVLMLRTTFLFLALVTSACASRTSASVDSSSVVVLSQNDILDRPYEVLGDIHVTVSKTTVFNSDPTEMSVAEALREKAASMGANALIFARFGSLTISAVSYGTMEGAGRAIRFVR